jgi:hypothetical protein
VSESDSEDSGFEDDNLSFGIEIPSQLEWDEWVNFLVRQGAWTAETLQNTPIEYQKRFAVDTGLEDVIQGKCHIPSELPRRSSGYTGVRATPVFPNRNMSRVDPLKLVDPDPSANTQWQSQSGITKQLYNNYVC